MYRVSGGGEVESMSETDGWRERGKRLKGASYALGHYGGMLIWLVNDSDLAVWDWCLAGLMTAERLSHTHTHTHTHTHDRRMKTYIRHICQKKHTHCTQEWTHDLILTQKNRSMSEYTHTHKHTVSLTGMCDLCLPPASRTEWVNMSWLIICFEHVWFPTAWPHKVWVNIQRASWICGPRVPEWQTQVIL